MHPEECPVRAALSVIGGKWKPVIARYLMLGTRRFGELRRLMPDVTQKMLTQQLREMEGDGVVARKIFQQVPPKVEYSLSPYGRTLEPILQALCKWGEAHREKKSGPSAGKRRVKTPAGRASLEVERPAHRRGGGNGTQRSGGSPPRR